MSIFGIKALFGRSEGEISSCVQHTAEAINPLVSTKLTESLDDRQLTLGFLSESAEETIIQTVKNLSGLFPLSSFYLSIEEDDYLNVLKVVNRQAKWQD